MQQLPGSGVHSSMKSLYLTVEETFNAPIMVTMQELSLTPANVLPFQDTDVLNVAHESGDSMPKLYVL